MLPEFVFIHTACASQALVNTGREIVPGLLIFRVRWHEWTVPLKRWYGKLARESERVIRRAPTSHRECGARCLPQKWFRSEVGGGGVRVLNLAPTPLQAANRSRTLGRVPRSQNAIAPG